MLDYSSIRTSQTTEKDEKLIYQQTQKGFLFLTVLREKVYGITKADVTMTLWI